MEQYEKNAAVYQEIETLIQGVATGNIADAMAKLGLSCGAIQGLLPLSWNQKLSWGFAVTIQQGYKTPGGKTKQRAVITTMTDSHDMVVIDAMGDRSASTAGGLLAFCGQRRGVSGFVVNGCLRDTDELLELDFPAWFLGTSPVGSAGVFETTGINVPLHFGGVTICPGDLIVQDGSGCIVIPQKEVRCVLTASHAVAQQENTCRMLLSTGMDFQEARDHGIKENPIPQWVFEQTE